MNSIAFTLIISYECKYFGELPKDSVRLITDHIVYNRLSEVKTLNRSYFNNAVESTWFVLAKDGTSRWGFLSCTELLLQERSNSNSWYSNIFID